MIKQCICCGEDFNAKNAAIKLCKKDYFVCPVCGNKIYIVKTVLSSTCCLSDYEGQLCVVNHEIQLDQLPENIALSAFICKDCKHTPDGKALANKYIQAKTKQTNLRKYGVYRNSQLDSWQKSAKRSWGRSYSDD